MFKVNSNISQKYSDVFLCTICLGDFTILTQTITILLKHFCLWLVQSGLVSHSSQQAHKNNASAFSLCEVDDVVISITIVVVVAIFCRQFLNSWMIKQN